MDFPDIKLKFLKIFSNSFQSTMYPPKLLFNGIKLHASTFSVVSGPWMKLDQRMFLLLNLIIKGNLQHSSQVQLMEVFYHPIDLWWKD